MSVSLFSSRPPWPEGRSAYPGPRVVRQPSDPDLEALKSGDEPAFEALIARYHGPMLRLAMSYLRDRGAAEDAVQETWLTCLRTLDRFEGRSALKTWVFGILLNVARSRHRKESRILPFTSLFLRDVAGFDADEVCGLLSISPANQRVRLHRGRASVRKALEEYLK